MIPVGKIQVFQFFPDEALRWHNFLDADIFSQRQILEDISGTELLGQSDGHISLRIDDIGRPDRFQNFPMIRAQGLGHDAANAELMKVKDS